MHHTPQLVIDALLAAIASLPPRRIAQAEAALATARQRAEAVVEIDGACPERPCPHCGGQERSSWGSTRTGLRRWRCKGCARTWCGSTGTPMAQVRRPDLLLELVRNMFEAEKPWSCRLAAKELGVSRHTTWRWRMAVLRALPPERKGALAGIVEADEARQRESRKGSREWVRYRANQAAHAKPPRQPWASYLCRNATVKAPPGGWRAWDRNLLAATDRSGHRVFEAVADMSLPVVSASLLPVMAPDTVLCTDGHLTYECLAKANRIPFFALNGGRRSRNTPKSHHINTVNALIGRYRTFIRAFRGPATKNLVAYGRWHAARDNADRNYLSVFRHLSGANTLC